MIIMISYSSDQAKETPNGSNHTICGFNISKSDLEQKHDKLLNTITEQPDQWFATEEIPTQTLIYFCERSAYYSGYINPLFSNHPLIFTGHNIVQMNGTSETYFVSKSGFQLEWSHTETQTIQLTLYEQHKQLQTTSTNILPLTPTDKLLSTIFDEEGKYLSTRI